MLFRHLRLLIFFFTITPLQAQSNLTPNQLKISNSLSDYFKMDRENIHLHLNKNYYLTSEQIWFKGYIIEKKYRPSQSTSNVYISLYDNDGQKIATQLYYAENAVFEGRIKLNNSLSSGQYFLRVYTNFMNNFSEDESSVYKITILNASGLAYQNVEKPNPLTAGITFFPESGIFLEGAANTVGVRIADCSNYGIAVVDAAIKDWKGNVVSTFSTDTSGYGKFEIVSTNAEIYKAVFEIDGNKIEKAMPLPVSTGISYSIVNYMYPNKTIVKLKTNSATLKQIKNLPYNLVFQQNETAVFMEFSFKENAPEQILSVSNTELSDGINTVYLIDQNLKKIGERMIYKPYGSANKTLLNIVRKNNDSIAITGSSPILSGSMSVSVLPIETLSVSPEKSIQAGLQFDNYLANPSEKLSYYLNDLSRKKQFELDNFLLSQKPKYDWETMLGDAPQKKFEFDIGLTIKGTINTGVKVKNDISINMNSFALGLNEMAPINDKNEFFFEHILAQDSTKIYFTAFDKKVKKPEMKVYSQLLNNNRAFMHAFTVNEKGCPESVNSDVNIPFPKVANAVLLDSINLVSKAKRLTHKDHPGNRMARGFKISAIDISSNRDILQFIEGNNFNVFTKRGQTYIQGYRVKPRLVKEEDDNPQFDGPAIYIDGSYVQNYDVLRDYSLTLVDEIYINKNYSDVSIRGSKGIIRIYTKTNSGISSNSYKKSEVLLVKNGFQGYHPFENPKYEDFRDEGFLKLGTVDWKPFVSTDANGTFHFSIPNLYQKSVKLVIEGMSADGLMISETIILNVP